MSYLKLNDNRYNLVGEEMVCDGQRLKLYIPADEITIPEIKNIFSNRDEFIVYDCVRNTEEDEKGNSVIVESDEYIATTFEGFTRIVAINYDIDLDIYEIVFISPIDIDARMADIESALNFLLMGGDL